MDDKFAAKLRILSDAAKYDASCASSGAPKRAAGVDGIGSTSNGICHAYTPDGRCVSLLKILLTNYCLFDCAYCINRRSSNVARARFSVEEVVQLTLNFYKRNYIEGLFLSSGIVKSPDHTMEEMMRVAKSLRQEHGYAGYIHLKTIPEASPWLIEQAGLFADRLSINLELPSADSLRALAPEKNAGTITSAMGQMHERIEEAKEDRRRFSPAGQSTQIIVGADATTDASLLDTSAVLYKDYALRRVYYSAFSPIPAASAILPLKAPPLKRENRLYQADWLLRFYGFTPEEVASGGTDGMLALDIDPKSAWALKNRHHFPLDVNTADREMLLRVPGLGTRSVDRIIAARRHTKLRLADVARLAKSVKRLRPFLITADYRPPARLAGALDLRPQLASEPEQAKSFLMGMIRMAVQDGADLDGFRSAVRTLVAQHAPPDAVIWSTANDNDLFGVAATPKGEAPAVSLPRDVGELIRLAICHSDPERFALLYRLVWRVLNGERPLLEVQSDPLVHRLQLMAKSVRRDIHKMHAFLRFRETHDPDGTERFVAWFEPEHHILDAAVPFFVERFRGMVWSILTPQGARHWDRETLVEGPPAHESDAPDSDAFEAAWTSYYESIFNPARVNPAAMRQHMPKKYWRNLPEAAAISDLVREAPNRAREMIEREAAMPTKRDPKKAVAAMAEQEPKSLEALNALIAASEPLTAGADHAVLGEGPIGADIAFVGEQPGDQEDLEGKPFIGPAGQMLEKALEEVGIDRKCVYVTNAVKHFKFEPRGKRRIHKKPNPGEVKRYRWWLVKELEFVRPKLVVALGGTALLGLTGKPLSVLRSRGPMQLGEFPGYATVHPSYLLRIPDAAGKEEAYEAFRSDLRRIKDLAYP